MELNQFKDEYPQFCNHPDSKVQRLLNIVSSQIPSVATADEADELCGLWTAHHLQVEDKELNSFAGEVAMVEQLKDIERDPEKEYWMLTNYGIMARRMIEGMIVDSISA